MRRGLVQPDADQAHELAAMWLRTRFPGERDEAAHGCQQLGGFNPSSSRLRTVVLQERVGDQRSSSVSVGRLQLGGFNRQVLGDHGVFVRCATAAGAAFEFGGRMLDQRNGHRLVGVASSATRSIYVVDAATLTFGSVLARY